MIRRSIAAGALLAAVAIIPNRPLAAQAVLGNGDDALTIPSGVFRLRVIGSWTAFNERYGTNAPGRPDGALEPLGIDFNLDTVGVTQFRSLKPLQAGVRALSGQNDFTVSLGKTVLSMNDQITMIPFVMEMGLTNRLSLGVTLPVVKTHVNVFFQTNPANREGNVGFNPATVPGGSTVKTADSAFAAQMVALATQVQTYCANNPSAAQCATGAALATDAIAFGNGLAQVYTTATFVPVEGSAIQQTIDARATSFKTALNQLATLVGGTAIDGNGVSGATSHLSTNDMQTVLTDPQYGVGAKPIESMDRWSIGDIELAAKLVLHEPFHDRATRMQPSGAHVRLAVGGMLRLPTGRAKDPDDFTDIASGTHEWAVGVRGYSDVLIGRHFWTSLVARYDVQMGDDRIMRITDTSGDVFTPLYTRAMVHRKLGNLLELEATPRWELNDFLSISAQYLYRHKPADQYTAAPYSVSNALTGGDTVLVDASTLDLETSLTEHRVGGGIAFSNLHAVSLGKARIPFEVSYQHLQTTSGTGGNVPKRFIDQIQLRIYAQLFGH